MLSPTQLNQKSKNYKAFIASAESYWARPFEELNEVHLGIAFSHFVDTQTKNFNSKLITGLLK
jgi:hypothetical protein